MQCLEDRQMTIFSVKRAKRLVRVKAIHKVKVYCICRIPSCTDSSWIPCSGCKEWFHSDTMCESTKNCLKQRGHNHGIAQSVPLID